MVETPTGWLIEDSATLLWDQIHVLSQYSPSILDLTSYSLCSGQNPEQYSSWSDSLTDDTMTTTGSLEEGSMEMCRSREGRGSGMSHYGSPSKFLAVEASAVLSTLQTIPEFAETMELIDSVRGLLCEPCLLYYRWDTAKKYSLYKHRLYISFAIL